MKMKKIISVIVALAMIISVMSFTVSAADSVKSTIKWQDVANLGFGASVGTEKYGSLQAAIDAIGTTAGSYTIEVNEPVAEDVTIYQYENVNITIDGNGYAFSGTVYVNGNARANGAETLTFENISFVTDREMDFISSNSTTSTGRYAHNVTVKDSTFKATGEGLYKAIGLRMRQAYNVNLINCTAEGLHSLMWATGGKGSLVDGVEMDNCKNGISFGTTDGVVVSNTTIEAVGDGGYGIRTNAEGDYSLDVTGCEISAFVPVLVRSAKSENYELNISDSEFTSSNPLGYEVAVTKGDYESANDEFVKADVSISTTLEGNYTVGSYVATVDGKAYTTLEAAIDAVEENEVVKLIPGTYDLDEKLVVDKPVVITGDPNYGHTTLFAARAVEKPVINITDVTNGGVQYQAPNVVFDNIVFNVDANATGSTWNVSALGYYYEDVRNREGLTVTNCDFINNSSISMSAIAANLSSYTITGNTFANFATGVHSYVDHGGVDNVVISDNTYTNVDTLANVYYGSPADGSANITITGNTSADGVPAKIAVTDFGQTKPAPATAYDNVTATDNEAVVVIGNYVVDAFNLVAANNTKLVYSYASEDMLYNLDIPAGEVYVNYGTDVETKYVTDGSDIIAMADSVELVFVENTSDPDALDNSVWDIVLQTSSDELINRLNSADFTFVLDSVNAMNYEIIPVNDEIHINPVDNSTDRYEFHYDGKTDVDTDTGVAIVIGQVRFEGYGEFSFKVADASTNAVHATTKFNNIVYSYDAIGGSLILNNADEDTDGDEFYGTIGSEVAVPECELAINVIFPNAVVDSDAAYQDMTVTIVGGTVNNTYNLGDATYADAAYTITESLPNNTTYVVTVSGAGYRTARYSVKLTTDKELTFWNNVMTEEKEIEKNNANSLTTKNFLAGDIVKDNQINIYDLSAVVSYFGTTGLSATENPAFAKYDLNRDGKIDSKDVAYVLVSWME